MFWITVFFFQISLAVTVDVNHRVPCRQEPVWNWERQGLGEMRLVWRQ